MKAAILINHYTAALFYNDILTSLGFQTYIPCQCGIEPLTMQEQSKIIRTIPHDEEISILDEYDFYLPATLTERKKTAMILNSKFDLIFTYHPINVNEYLLNSATKVYFIIWGDISNDHFMHYRWKKYFFSSSTFYDKIISSNEKYFIIANDHLKEDLDSNQKYLSLPIGINHDIERYLNCRKPITNGKIIIILSRVHKLVEINPFFLSFMHQLFSGFPNQHFQIIGKENNNAYFQEFSNVEMIRFENTSELYAYVSNGFVSINYSIHENVLQFSPLEMACFNVPQFYMRGSAVDKLLQQDNHFRYDDIQDLKFKLSLFLEDPTSYQDIAENNNQRLYQMKSFSNSLTIWGNYFRRASYNPSNK